MAAWDRKTPWRQGHALTNEAAVALGLVTGEVAATAVVMVISHDCDITQLPEVEPSIEIIIGARVAAANGNFTHAKNPRRIHLPCTENGSAMYLELRAIGKREIPKDRFAEYLPNGGLELAPKNLSILQQWLASRYRRAAFPDEFENRLRETGLGERIKKIVEPLGTHLVAIFFDVDEGKELERKGPDDRYMLGVDLLYSTESDPFAALGEAEQAASAISAAFRERCFIAGKGWQEIELLGCEPISDEAMSYAMSTQLKKWNADYLSLRVEPAPGITHAE
ncbi:MAG: hypothetical protein WBR14_06840 [Candidatus Acidiferrum sp.]